MVEQNAQLKKEVAIAERKLVARGERIRGLEGLVQESQEKLMVANHKYVYILPRAWEHQLTDTSQVRKPTHGCQRTARSRQDWVYSWPAQLACAGQLRAVSIRQDSQTTPWRRRWRRRPPICAYFCWSSAAGEQRQQAQQLVLQPARLVASRRTVKQRRTCV